MKRHIKQAGKLLRASRKRLGITQTEAAKRLECTQGLVCFLENGHHAPRRELAKRIQKKFRVPVSAWTLPPRPE